MWGVFELDNGEVHVAPVHEVTHEIINGHELNMTCFCMPRIIHEAARVVINHYDKSVSGSQ